MNKETPEHWMKHSWMPWDFWIHWLFSPLLQLPHQPGCSVEAHCDQLSAPREERSSPWLLLAQLQRGIFLSCLGMRCVLSPLVGFWCNVNEVIFSEFIFFLLVKWVSDNSLTMYVKCYVYYPSFSSMFLESYNLAYSMCVSVWILQSGEVFLEAKPSKPHLPKGQPLGICIRIVTN